MLCLNLSWRVLSRHIKEVCTAETKMGDSATFSLQLIDPDLTKNMLMKKNTLLEWSPPWHAGWRFFRWGLSSSSRSEAVWKWIQGQYGMPICWRTTLCFQHQDLRLVWVWDSSASFSFFTDAFKTKQSFKTNSRSQKLTNNASCTVSFLVSLKHF